MSDVIRNFYVDNKVPEVLLKQKESEFDQNPDIANEFEHWIATRKYKKEGAVCVEGYTAEKLSKLSAFLEGEGAFLMLIELRRNPKRALETLNKGFKLK